MNLINKKENYLGVVAFGIKGGVILPGDDIASVVVDILRKPFTDNLLADGDVVCVTESVVARSQDNYVSVDDIALEVRRKLGVKENDVIGVLFPILSRNRFSLLLKGIARAVNKGKVILQLSFPLDEVGNRLITDETLQEMGKILGSRISREELEGKNLTHPITGVNYLSLYEEIIKGEGVVANIFLSNDPLEILSSNPKGVIVSSIHQRDEINNKLTEVNRNVLTLQEFFNQHRDGAWSEWGLLGSNLSYPERVKLAPRDGNEVACKIQSKILDEFDKKVEVIIYGDGAYKDPISGIYELADPQPAFGVTKGLSGRWRIGLKYKYIADVLHKEGKSRDVIEGYINTKKETLKTIPTDATEELGTTPRRAEDILASLADLISGSADAATPIVVVKGF